LLTMRLIIFFASLLFATSRAQTAACSNSSPCDDGSFCDFQNRNDGFCLPCSSDANCFDQSGLTTEGVIACYEVCEAKQTVITMPGCSSTSKCGVCQGTCSSDDDCQDGLSCKVRAVGDSVSGCIFPGNREAGVSVQDIGQSLCYDPDAEASDERYQMEGYLVSIYSSTPCHLLEEPAGRCSGVTAPKNQLIHGCERSFCRTSDNRCFVQGLEVGTACTYCTEEGCNELDTNGVNLVTPDAEIYPGLCVDGQCVWNENAVCPEGTFAAERVSTSCGDQNFSRTWRMTKTDCPKTGSTCDDFGPSVSELRCWTSATKIDNIPFLVNYHDPNDVNAVRDGHSWGKCIIGQYEGENDAGDVVDCVMNTPGFYTYRNMDILWTVGENNNEAFTVLEIPFTQKLLAPVMHCAAGEGEACRGTIDCSMLGSQPCARTYTTCDGTAGPTASPTVPPTRDPLTPTSNPTRDPTKNPSNTPTRDPLTPTSNPTKTPTRDPTKNPSKTPTRDPLTPTKNPSNTPTHDPLTPTKNPSNTPTRDPLTPTSNPSKNPTRDPTKNPSKTPTRDPLVPTRFPSFHPTSNPTNEPTIPASHGDPIIWTFFGECYDLNKDGIYLATSHPKIDHDVYIAVYNDYMREIQIRNKNGDILLSVNNLGDVLNNWPYRFTEEVKPCPLEEYCNLFYKEFTFDAQQFRFIVQVLPHDYLDPALKDGEEGVHLDIFPRPYQAFTDHKHLYEGLYFSNPLPEILEYCPEGSQRHH